MVDVKVDNTGVILPETTSSGIVTPSLKHGKLYIDSTDKNPYFINDMGVIHPLVSTSTNGFYTLIAADRLSTTVAQIDLDVSDTSYLYFVLYMSIVSDVNAIRELYIRCDNDSSASYQREIQNNVPTTGATEIRTSAQAWEYTTPIRPIVINLYIAGSNTTDSSGVSFFGIMTDRNTENSLAAQYLGANTITNINLYLNSNNFNTGTFYHLYGVKQPA